MRRTLRRWIKQWREARRKAASERVPPVEAFRMVRLALEGAAGEAKPRLIALTSATADDGKAEVAAGLATSLSEEGQRVLLVDFDLYRPRLHRLLSVNPAPGLSDLVEGSSYGLRHVVQPAAGGIDVVSAGEPLDEPSVFYVRSSLERITASLRHADSYDAVVVVAPAILEASGARFLGALVDDLVLAVRSGFTRERDVRAVKELSDRDRLPLRGAVLIEGEAPASASASVGRERGARRTADSAEGESENERASTAVNVPPSAVQGGGRLL